MSDEKLMPKQQLALRAVWDAEKVGLKFKLVKSVAFLHNGRHRVQHAMVIFPPTYQALVRHGYLEAEEELALTDEGRQWCESRLGTRRPT